MALSSLKIITAALIGITLSGCNTLQAQQQNVVRIEESSSGSCSLPSGKRVDDAFAMAKSELSDQSCQMQFHSFFEALMEVAKGDPGADNKKRFSDFLTWSYERGIISKRQGKDYYTQYFSSTFTSLTDTLNVCSASRNKQTMLQDMESELKMKKLGMMEVSGDRDAYFGALRQHSDIVLVLEATALACQAQS